MTARALFAATFAAGFSCAAGDAVAQTPEIADTLFMSDAAGSKRVGHIVGVDTNSFKIEIMLAGGVAKATVAVPRARVSRVEFAPNEMRDRLVAAPTSANAGALGALWQKWLPFLEIAKSPAGKVGNAYAAALAVSDPAQAARALGIFKLVEAKAWNTEDESAAKQGRLRLLVATGHAADAVAEAQELARQSDNPTVLIEAKFILAEAAQAKLRKLVEDNPRWTEDPLVRPEYDQLYNDALDLYLHPYLFRGSNAEAASRGLWGAMNVYRFGGDERNAVESARDLVMLYSGTHYAALAREYLDKLPADLKKRNSEKTPDVAK